MHDDPVKERSQPLASAVPLRQRWKALGTLTLWGLAGRRGWRRELIWTGLLLLLAAAALAWGGWLLPAAMTALLLTVLRHLLRLLQLGRWLGGSIRGPVPGSDGIWTEVFQDIEQLQRRGRKRKRKLTRALHRFNEATEALPDGAVVLGREGEIEWWNRAAERLLGLQRATDRGQRITDLMRRPEFVARMNRDAWTQPLEMPSRADPQLWLSVRVVPLSKRRRLLLARDITRLRRLEQMRRDFVGNVSHELRTPLTVMSGYVEALLESEGGDNPGRERALQRMQEQTRRMQTLVADLLHLSRLELDQPRRLLEPVVLARMIDTLVEETRTLSGGAHTLEVDEDRDLGLFCQPEEIRSAFSNILSNAVRYTPEGGTITVRWFQEPEGEACFEVTDSGVGIEPVHLPRLTERFYRVDVGRSRETGGTGLGLAIVKHVLGQHDGRLEVESRPGQGSTFRCRFAAARVHRQPAPSRQAQ